MDMGSAQGSRAACDVVEMDGAATGRLVRALRAGVTGSALEQRFGRSGHELRRIARRAGWDGTVTGACEFAPLAEDVARVSW